MSLLDGIHAEAVEILKDKPITAACVRMLKRVKSLRQIEMAQLMVSTNNYTRAYLNALLIGTQKHMLAKEPAENDRPQGLTPEELGRMEKEMESLERDFRLFQDDYGENSLHLNSALRYVRRLTDNPRIKRYLENHHQEILEELLDVTQSEEL